MIVSCGDDIAMVMAVTLKPHEYTQTTPKQYLEVVIYHIIPATINDLL